MRSCFISDVHIAISKSISIVSSFVLDLLQELGSHGWIDLPLCGGGSLSCVVNTLSV